MSLYVVSVQHPYNANVQGYLHKKGLEFSTKDVDGGSIFMVEMEEIQKDKLLKKYKSVVISEPEYNCVIEDLEDESEIPFTQIVPDNPDKKTYYKELTVVLIAFVAILVMFS